METIWITKMLLAHLLTDFVLQPRSWIDARRKDHFASPYLYLHGSVTAFVAMLITGWEYWPYAIVIGVTHILIDGWKSYRQPTIRYFLIDQVLHLLVICACWYFLFFEIDDLLEIWNDKSTDTVLWIHIAAFVFLSYPAAILIGELTRKWRDKLPDSEGLANAGKWIGILERTIILILMLQDQFAAIGFLIAAKSFLRYNENNRTEIKTEYLLIGTLISISIAIITGLITVWLTA